MVDRGRLFGLSENASKAALSADVTSLIYHGLTRRTAGGAIGIDGRASVSTWIDQNLQDGAKVVPLQMLEKEKTTGKDGQEKKTKKRRRDNST